MARLAARGVLVAPITLHTGVSSPERDERPTPSAIAVPATTARLVNAVRGGGGRVIAGGHDRRARARDRRAPAAAVEAAAGWTSVVITPERGLRAVDGLLTGWHEPRASHLLMLEAVAGRGAARARLRGRARRTATCGTSSATATSCCPDRGASRVSSL